jgi:uncharacterized repeat protein (TIGR03943 family)
MSILYRWAQILVLALTGLYFAYTAASGNITNYIAERFVWLTWGAAGLLLVMAAVRARRMVGGSPPSHHDHAHDTGGIGAWIGLGIVALPALIGLLVPSRPLGSAAVEGEITGDLGSIAITSSRVLDIAPEDRSILDWVRAISAAPDPGALNGQAAVVEGFVRRDARFDAPGQFMVARFVISCCVADAQAVGLVVETPEAGSYREDDWVRVRGTFQVQTFDGAPTAVLVADPDGVTRITRPSHPYLYP